MNTRLALLLSTAVLSAFSAPAMAQAADTEPATTQVADTEQVRGTGPNQYFAVLPGYFIADKGRNTKDHGITGSLVYGYRFNPSFGMELNVMGSTIETGDGNGTDFYQEGGTVDLVFDYRDRAVGWTPFMLLGAGAVYNDVIPDSQDKVTFIANAGLGLVTAPFTSLGIKLRAEGRYQYDDFQKGQQDVRLLAGIEFPFGGERVVVAVATPPTVEIREVIRPYVDTDKDTIEDSRDKCPDTPEGLKVDADGCVIEGQNLELRGVTFAFNKSDLQLNAQTVLDYVTKGMNGQPSMTVEIAGHTDSVGSAAYNIKLSQRRAEAVLNYLLAQGIAEARLTAKGYGESELLINPENDALDQERNRRVMFRVLSK